MRSRSDTLSYMAGHHGDFIYTAVAGHWLFIIIVLSSSISLLVLCAYSAFSINRAIRAKLNDNWFWQ